MNLQSLQQRRKRTKTVTAAGKKTSLLQHNLSAVIAASEEAFMFKMHAVLIILKCTAENEMILFL